MGSSVAMAGTPRFEVRAVGAFEQKPGCPPDTLGKMGAARVASVCGGECYHPGDTRRPIERIEVVRIRPQRSSEERMGPLIEDPWRVFDCPAEAQGCRIRFEDPEHASGQRDSVYYVRVIQSPTPTINGDGLRCLPGEAGRCAEVRPCFASAPTDPGDDCLADASERAWSSPIFVDHAGS